MPTLGRLKHRSHPHTLELKIKEEAFNCDVCKDVGFGKRYTCPRKGCDFHIHKECSELPVGTRHDLLKGRYLELKRSAVGREEFTCDACCRTIKGSYYRNDKGDHDLHPCCALNLKNRISKDDGVVLHLKEKLSDECDLCGREKLSLRRKPSWGYVSRDKKYQVHLYCAKKKLIDHHENIMLGIKKRRDGHGESSVRVLSVIKPPDQSQIESRDSHVSKNRNTRKGKMVSTVNKILRIVFNLVVAVLFGNPAGLIVDVGSLLFFT